MNDRGYVTDILAVGFDVSFKDSEHDKVSLRFYTSRHDAKIPTSKLISEFKKHVK